MTGREKIEMALSADGSPAFAAVICYEGIFIRDHWREVTDQPWWVMSSPDIEAQEAFYADRISRIGQDWVALSAGMSRRQRERRRIEERADGVYALDVGDSSEARLDPPAVSGWRPQDGCHSVRPANPPRTREDVDRCLPLDAGFNAARPLAEGADDLPCRVMAGPGRDLFPIGSVGAPLWSNYSLLGFEGLMRLVLEDPGLVEYACGRRVEMARRTVARLKAIGARGVWIEECMTDMISPDAFRRLNLPFLREVVGVIRDAGMFSIYYYCGDPGDRLDLLIESGADAISLEESKKGFQIDITDVVDRVRGRCAVLGNLDAIGLLAHGSEADLCDEISRQLAAGRRNRGRFVMSLGSPVTPETPLRRVRLYADLVHRLSPG